MGCEALNEILLLFVVVCRFFLFATKVFRVRSIRGRDLYAQALHFERWLQIEKTRHRNQRGRLRGEGRGGVQSRDITYTRYSAVHHGIARVWLAGAVLRRSGQHHCIVGCIAQHRHRRHQIQQQSCTSMLLYIRAYNSSTYSSIYRPRYMGYWLYIHTT